VPLREAHVPGHVQYRDLLMFDDVPNTVVCFVFTPDLSSLFMKDFPFFFFTRYFEIRLVVDLSLKFNL